jgi:hypothetical protein
MALKMVEFYQRLKINCQKLTKVQQISIASFIFLWAVSSTYFTQPTFVDELDNIISGNQIRHGRVPYQDFFSQHTPIAYYISSLGHLIGANSLIEQRVFFYSLFSLFFSLMTLRHAKIMGHYTVPLAGLILLSSHAANPVMAYTILSDQYQALAYVAIFLEIIRLAFSKSSTYSSWTILSIASFVAVGVAAISVFFVTVSVLLFVIVNSFYLLKNPLFSGHKIKNLLVKNLQGFFILSLPFCVFFAYLLTSRSWNDFYYQAYVINREVYSGYIGGFGKSLLDPFKQALPSFFNSFASLTVALGEPTIQNLRYFLNFAGIALFALLIMVRNVYLAPISIVVFAFSISRGIYGFHSQPFWALSGLALAFLLVGNLLPTFKKEIWNLYSNLFRRILILSLLPILFISFAALSFSTYSKGFPKTFERPETSMEKVIRILVPKDGTYGNSSINVYEYVSTDRLPANGVTGLVPWMVQNNEELSIHRLKESSPDLIFYNSANEVWGYKLRDYAPLLNQYVENHYKKVPVSPNFFEGQYVYLRSNSYPILLNKLRTEFPDVFMYTDIYTNQSKEFSPLGEIIDGTLIEQKFLVSSDGFSQVKIYAATYARENSCSLKASLYAGSGELITTAFWKCQSLVDNSYISLKFPTIQNSKNMRFVLKVESKGATPGNAVTLWTGLKSGLNEGELFIDAQRQLGDIVLQLSKTS